MVWKELAIRDTRRAEDMFRQRTFLVKASPSADGKKSDAHDASHSLRWVWQHKLIVSLYAKKVASRCATISGDSMASQ